MTDTAVRPAQKPQNPCFSSGPCAKRPGWSVEVLKNGLFGRSHRAAVAKDRIKAVLNKHRALLNIPADYKIAIVPASDTGAVEMALWSMLGARGVDVLSWEVFSEQWQIDIVKHLKINDTRAFKAGYGAIPDLAQTSPDRDIVFVWNGTTSGVRVPDGNWISDKREGLTFCDATSAVFAYDMPWNKLDVTTWSWQKVLGGEAAHGMIVLSPRAVQRLESYTPAWPLPKIFRMTKGGKLMEAIFEGDTINTVSLMAIEDCLDALNWVEKIGGVKETTRRAAANFAVLDAWVKKTPWIEHLAEKPETRSHTSACLKITDSYVSGLDEEAQHAFIKSMTKLLDKEGVAYDITGHRDAPPGLRLWIGATVEEADVKALLPWLEWAFAQAKAEGQKKAA